jgi:CheY-like chemotaxis protein
MALRVLLADESTTIKKVMQLALQDFAVEVKSVQSGVDVVEVAKTFLPDIIFVDVLLQKKNGYEVCADVKRENALNEIPLVLMWSSFMDLDERMAQSSGCDRRLEKPFDVENLRQIVLELVPKTRSQRLAHFLKFPDTLTDSLKTEEAGKSRASTPPPVVSRAPAVELPPPVERQPLAQRPPPVERQTPVQRDDEPAFDEITRRGPITQVTPPPQITMPTIRIDGDQGEIENEIIHDHGAGPGVDLVAQPPAQRGSSKDDPRSNWNMESFEEIEDFSNQSAGPSLVPPLEQDHSAHAADPDEDAGFKEFRIAQTNRGKAAGRTDDKNLELDGKRKLTSEDRDPWSHQDLARFKLDLPPIESDDGQNQIQLENDDMEPGEHSDFLHRREGTARGKAPAPPTIELETYGEHDGELEDAHQSGSGITASGIDIDDLEIEEEIPHDPGLSLHDEPSRVKKPRTAIPSLDADRLEEIIRAQSREIIEAVVRRIVPDLATDIIRQELNRLLDDKGTR